MSSSAHSELDLDRDLPTTSADVEALRRAREQHVVSTGQYLRFLALLAPRTNEASRARPGPRGIPFALD
jgi:hypothetical protein